MSRRVRLHPSVIVMNLLSTFKDFLVPLLFFTFTAFKNQSFEWWNLFGIVGILIFSVISSVVRWFRFFYSVTERELQIEYGLFVRKQRFVPFERIQSIHVTEGILHRLFGVVKLEIETAGGNVEPEAQLSSLKRKQAEELQLWIRQQKSSAKADENLEEQEVEPIERYEFEFRLPKKALFIVASTSGGFGILFSFIGAIFSQIEEFLPERFYESVFETFLSSGIAFIAVLIFVIALLAWIVSFISTVLRFGGFTVKKKENELIIERGLLEKRKVTIPINKVQAVRIDEGILRQPFGYATVSVEVAGSSGDEDEQSTMIHPLIKTKQIHSFLQHVLPAFVEEVEFQSVPKRALRRYIFRNVWFFIAAVCAAFWFIPYEFAWLSLLLVLFGVVLGIFKHRDAGWWLSDRLISVRFRNLKRTTLVTLRKRIQSFEYGQSWLQARRELASFEIAVLGGIFGNYYSIVDMDAKKADELFHQLRIKKVNASKRLDQQEQTE